MPPGGGAAASAGHAELAGTLGNLGNVLLLKARQAGDAASLDKAISVYRRALLAGLPGSLPYANVQVSLGQALIILAARDASLVALDEAAELLGAGTDALPPHHPALADLRAQLDHTRAAARAGSPAAETANAVADGDGDERDERDERDEKTARLRSARPSS